MPATATAGLALLLVALNWAGADASPSSASLSLEPESIELVGPRSARQMLVSAAEGTRTWDATREVKYSISPADVAAIDPAGLVTPLAEGVATLTAQWESHQATTTIKVHGFDVAQPVDFTTEVIPALTRNGCNSGPCHGTPSGKNGFRLSLQGYLPDQDYWVLTREAMGRRVNPIYPESSLVLQKGTARIPHGGGKMLWANEHSHAVLETWIREGCQRTASIAEVVGLDVLPSSRVLHAPAREQQIVVLARLADGDSRDVTRLVSFHSSDPKTAEVSKGGLVTFRAKGSVAILCRYLHFVENAKLTFLEPRPDFSWPDIEERNLVDQHVFAKLREMEFAPSALVDDATFLRRVFLDVMGVLPTPEEIEEFQSDSDPEKRARWLDRLLERPEYADFWAMKWADLLRNHRRSVAVRGVHQFRRYLVEVFLSNRPFDEFVRELITSQGNSAIQPAASYYRVVRDPQVAAETTAQLFLGVRMQCAKCHNHPFERWTQDDYYSLAAYFARVRQKKPDGEVDTETVFLARDGEVRHPRTGAVLPPKAPGAEPLKAADESDRRTELANWLTDPNNAFFARSVVNRVWYHLLGRGIVDPVDDFRDSNPPSNPELLDALAEEFVRSGHDMKALIRLIVLSHTYQAGSEPTPSGAEDDRYFSHAYARLHPAEVLLDAISDATGLPEKFAGLPLGTRAIQLPDGEVGNTFLQAFGQPTRELACECGRESEATLNQALNLINGDTVHSKLRDPNNRIGRLLQEGKSPSEVIDALYLATLSRRPSASELETALAHVASMPDPRPALEDLQWVLLNSKEFLFRR